MSAYAPFQGMHLPAAPPKTGRHAAKIMSDFPPLLQRIYNARGVRDPNELDYSLDNLLPTNALKGIDQARCLLADAVMHDKRILIVGDFDADGATATAVLVRALSKFGATSVNFLVPNRLLHSYGLSTQIVELAQEHHQPNLLITVDNGISSIAGVALAKRYGIQTLVTDHHLPGLALPDADAIINPNQPGCAFPSKHLAGVGVAFYLAIALRQEFRENGWFAKRGIGDTHLGELLDLVALGTVADMVTLDHNNRILVAQGLQRIRNGLACPGIRALFSVAKRDFRHADASALGFAVAPRLNAAGRLRDMRDGIECLLGNDPTQCLQLARQLDTLNRERKSLQRKTLAEAESLLPKNGYDVGELAGLCVYEPHWHQGIVGLVAGRLCELHQRPVIAFAPQEPGLLKGSGRSVSGVHLRDALQTIAERHPHLLGSFGGHAMAAGLSLKEEHVEEFRTAFAAVVAEIQNHSGIRKEWRGDGALEPNELSLETALSLRNAGPWGMGFPEPLFFGDFTLRSLQPFAGANHIKLRLSRADTTIAAIAFNFANAQCIKGAREVRLEYRLQVDEFAGRQKIILIAENIEPC
ncbi:MAG: single-stranded-DNA-specific exonuclease RecJ [Candidatus Eutrophobiaceae bacterium]